MEIVYADYFDYDRHAATIPPLTEERLDQQRHRVVICGGGPTGLALALDLSNYGIPSLVLEADDTVCTGSRAGAFTRRTLEICDQLGVADAMLETALGWKTGWTFYGETEIARLEMQDDENQKFPPIANQLQNYIEHCLAREIERRRDLIEIRWQSKVVDLAPGSDGVRVAVETPMGNYDLDADWLVACDGGRSKIRQTLGLRMHGERHSGQYVIVDIRIDNRDFRIGRHCWFDPPSMPGSTVLLYHAPLGLLRLDYQLRPDDDVEAATRPDQILHQVGRHLEMLGVKHPWTPVWMTLYRASAMTLDSYRHGRVLLAGDAAHLIPIFGVRGMNSAIEDVHNLAWKLAFVLKGTAGEALLDTYTEERVYAARENIRYGSKGAEFMSPPSPSHRLMRDAVLSLAKRHPWLSSLMIPRQHSAAALTRSSLGVASDDAFPAGPAPGLVLPECPVRVHHEGAVRDDHLTSLLGPRFTVFYFSDDGSVPAALQRTCTDLAREAPLALRIVSRVAAISAATPILEDHTGRLFPMYGATPGTVYVVRPDGHVLARWREGTPAALAAAVRRCLMRPVAANAEALSA